MQHPLSRAAAATAPQQGEPADRGDGQARLLAVARRRLAELTTVQRVAQAITSAVRLDQLCATVVEQVGQAFGYRLVSIYLREGQALHLQASVGYEHVLTTIGLDQGMSGRVVRTGQPCFVRDASAEPDFLHAMPGIRQGIFVPLRFADGPALGMIAVESAGDPLLTDEDLALLALLADQISVAVVNARLFDQREEAASRFNALMESTGNVIVALTPDLRVTALNREAARTFGRAPAQALGQSFLASFVAPPERAAVAALARAAIDGTPAAPIETAVTGADGRERTFLWTAACRTDPAGAPAELLVIGHDITARRAAEEARLAMERKMLEAQRLESLGVLAGGIAHDFNNMLAAILGNASLLLLDLPPGSEAFQSARQIELVTARAADLVGQMLAYAGRGRFVVQPVDLNALVAEMIVLLRASISKGAALIQHLGPGLPTVEGDPAQLRQVVMNLIVNASEALAPESGAITITTGLRAVGAATLAAARVGADLPPGPYLALTVADTGGGMDAPTSARIFDPFFSTKLTGRGLGLAAVLGIVRSHRGALLVASEPGRGSSFTVLLPPAPRPPAPPAPPLSQPGPPQAPATSLAAGQGPVVLLVDDEDEVRHAFGRILERAGYSVVTSADGESAATLGRALGPALAAVLLDLTMPRTSAAALVAELRRAQPRLPVLLMSGYSAQELDDDLAAATDFIQKPFGAAELLARLAQLIAARR